MEHMPATHEIKVLDLIELTEPVNGIPAGAKGGVLELREGDKTMVEITSIDELDIVDRIVFPSLTQLRRIPRPSDIAA